MLKYEPLYHYLLDKGEDSIKLTYEEIEDIIKASLPPSAHKYSEFWGTGNHSQIKSINNAGYKIIKSDIKEEYIELLKTSVQIEKADEAKTKGTTKIKENNKEIKTICNTDLDEASNDVSKDPTYGKETELIRDCILKFPENTSAEIVAMKVGLIDITNSTHISAHKKKISVVDLVNILLNIKDFDNRLAQGDITLVEEISKETKEKHNINLFSFASKYCCYHNMYAYGKDDFSIFDNVLKEHIPDYSSSVTESRIEDLRITCNYKGYCDIIDEILKNNNITTQDKRRKFDNLVWYYNRNKNKIQA